MFATDKTVVATDAAQLVQCLDEQAAIFEQWYASEDDKVRALLARDREALESVIATQERLMAALHSLQDNFVQQLERLASIPLTHGGKAEIEAEAQIAKLWAHVMANLAPSMAEQMLAARQRVSDWARRVRERGEQNQELLQQAAAHNAVILEAIVGPAQETVTYGAPAQTERTTTGRGTQSSARRLVDWQA